jgi:DNA-binding transcriptional ArsR family regulator
LASDEEIIESELKGKTLLVYMHILKSKESSVGVRAVQRALGFSSPSVSSYHLNKLKDLGLVESIRGDYSLIREVRVGVLKQFTTVIFGLVPLVILWYETYRLWRDKPR